MQYVKPQTQCLKHTMFLIKGKVLFTFLLKRMEKKSIQVSKRIEEAIQVTRARYRSS